jgi:Glycosyl hydrolase catalytic core
MDDRAKLVVGVLVVLCVVILIMKWTTQEPTEGEKVSLGPAPARAPAPASVPVPTPAPAPGPAPLVYATFLAPTTVPAPFAGLVPAAFSPAPSAPVPAEAVFGPSPAPSPVTFEAAPSPSFTFAPVPEAAPAPSFFGFSPAPAPTGSSKKGFVYDLKINGAPNTQFNTQMQSLNLGWYYTWGLTGSPGLNLPFTPMVWGAPDAAKLNQIPSGSKELLAFNEPDGNQPGAQSNISIETIVSLWPQLKATGLRIGSVAAYTSPLATSYTAPDAPPPAAQPSIPTTSYFDSLWTALTNAGMQPDFIALHWYAPPDAAGFLKWIDDIYAKYQKPIWITEMCVADWQAGKPGQPAFERFTVEQIQTFMDAVVAGMNSRSYVERFCWKTRPTTDVNLGNGALIALDGTLTPLGQHYATL